MPSSSAPCETLPRFIFQSSEEGLDEIASNSFIVVGVEGSAEVEVASDGDLRYVDLFGQEVDLLEEGYLTFAWREAKDVDLTLLREKLATEILQECSLALAILPRSPTTLP